MNNKDTFFLDTYKLKYIEINDQIKYNKKLKGLTF